MAGLDAAKLIEIGILFGNHFLTGDTKEAETLLFDTIVSILEASYDKPQGPTIPKPSDHDKNYDLHLQFSYYSSSYVLRSQLPDLTGAKPTHKTAQTYTKKMRNGVSRQTLKDEIVSLTHINEWITTVIFSDNETLGLDIDVIIDFAQKSNPEISRAVYEMLLDRISKEKLFEDVHAIVLVKIGLSFLKRGHVSEAKQILAMAFPSAYTLKSIDTPRAPEDVADDIQSLHHLPDELITELLVFGETAILNLLNHTGAFRPYLQFENVFHAWIISKNQESELANQLKDFIDQNIDDYCASMHWDIYSMLSGTKTFTVDKVKPVRNKEKITTKFVALFQLVSPHDSELARKIWQNIHASPHEEIIDGFYNQIFSSDLELTPLAQEMLINWQERLLKESNQIIRGDKFLDFNEQSRYHNNMMICAQGLLSQGLFDRAKTIIQTFLWRDHELGKSIKENGLKALTQILTNSNIDLEQRLKLAQNKGLIRFAVESIWLGNRQNIPQRKICYAYLKALDNLGLQNLIDEQIKEFLSRKSHNQSDEKMKTKMRILKNRRNDRDLTQLLKRYSHRISKDIKYGRNVFDMQDIFFALVFIGKDPKFSQLTAVFLELAIKKMAGSIQDAANYVEHVVQMIHEARLANDDLTDNRIKDRLLTQLYQTLRPEGQIYDEDKKLNSGMSILNFASNAKPLFDFILLHEEEYPQLYQSLIADIALALKDIEANNKSKQEKVAHLINDIYAHLADKQDLMDPNSLEQSYERISNESIVTAHKDSLSTLIPQQDVDFHTDLPTEYDILLGRYDSAFLEGREGGSQLIRGRNSPPLSYSN